MRAEDSIRTDAPTVHRRAPDAQSDSQKSELSDAAAAAVDAGELPQNVDDELAEARTVVRSGSQKPESAPAAKLDRTPAAVAQILLGKRLNHFLLEELIGGGGMGAVFRARDERLDRTVAIKVIPFVGEDADLKRRFRNEAQSAARLDHPRIARVFEVGNQDDWHYIVFEYVSGINIRDKVAREGPLVIDDAVFATCQLAEALQHAADRGIVHRDIKPSNIVIGEDDQIKLVDMGLARSENLDLSDDMTASGVTLGTFDYISPEQARDPRDADVRSDIYSLGCTLYYMLTGRPPFPGGTMLQKLLSHGNTPPPDARLVRPEISDGLMTVIRRMLAKSPADRYQNARELVLDLRQVAERDGLVKSQEVASVAVAEPNRLLLWLERHTPWLVAAALLLISAAWLQMSRDSFTIAFPERQERADSLAPPENEPEAASAPSPADGALQEPPLAASEDDEEAIVTPLDFAAEPPELIEQDPDAASPPLLRQLLPEEGGPRFEIPLPNEGTFAEGLDGSPSPLDVDQGGDGSLDDSTAAPELQTVRVVASEAEVERSSEPGVVFVTTLEEAVAVAQAEGLSRIELSAAEIVSGPISVNRPEITIESTLDSGSTVVFRSEDQLSMQRTSMLRIGASRATFNKLHFIWSVPLDEVDGGSVFVLHSQGLLRMNDCSVTVENTSRRDEVYAFDVITDPEVVGPSPREAASTRAAGALPLVAIELNDVVVRGEMTMVHMDYAAELQLAWVNGLLAISRRMLDTAGALSQPSEAAGPIQLSLERVTALAPLGLVRMRLGVSGRYPIPIDRDASKCVFVVDEEVPHVEISGLRTGQQDRSLLRARGEENAYDASSTLSDLFFVRADEEGGAFTTRLNQLTQNAPPPPWWGESSSRWTVRWTKIDLPNVAPSHLTPSDFRQEGILGLGFNEQELPPLPAVSGSLTTGDQVSSRISRGISVPKRTEL